MADSVAKGLGVFSLALGAAELVAPDWLRRRAGVRASTRVVRAFGVREVVAGLTTLSSRTRRAGLWSRVAGDAIDLAVIVRGRGGWLRRRRRANTTSLAMVAGVTALDLASALRARSWAAVPV